MAGGRGAAGERGPFAGRLRPGETILWQGRPDVRRYLLRGAAVFVPMSLLWCGFAVYWEVGVATSGAPSFFRLWGAAFVLVGLYAVGGRFWVARREAEHTAYAVTSERVLIRTGAFGPRAIELELSALPGLELRGEPGGFGTIVLQQAASPGGYGSGFTVAGWGGHPRALCNLPDAGAVYRLISNLRRSEEP